MDIPDTFDAEGDNVEQEWDFTTLTGYLEYRESQQKIVRRSSGNFDNVPSGIHFIMVTLTDDNPQPLSSLYTVQVNIEPSSSEICSDGSPGPCEEGDPLEAIISSMTNTGSITINFDDGTDLEGLLAAL